MDTNTELFIASRRAMHYMDHNRDSVELTKSAFALQDVIVKTEKSLDIHQ